MGRGGKIGFKRTDRSGVQSKEKGSDESDEEYKLEEDEELDESDEYCSLDGDESEELLPDFVDDDEEDEEEKNVKRVVRSKPAQKSSRQRKTNQVKKPQKRRRVSRKVDEDEVEEEDDDYEDEDEDEDEDDEEFMLDESDCVDEEDEVPVMKSRPPLQKRGLSKGKKRTRKPKVLKKPARQKSRKNRRLTRKTSSVKNAEVTEKSIVVQERSRNTCRRKRRTKEDSDSDFVSSVSSDFEYTISEEEREQVREATKFCTNFNTSLRSSLSMKRSQEETVCPQRRRTGRKGKEKVADTKNEVVKQVCGICLSEEGKKTVRGSLNCCSHYFCFACIMEWSKVESRCPLCKQRFMTISKPARSDCGFELRTVVIQVPERDQVYQPSEEEVRGYVDPYENVICTECQQGGEDALMLLCDICDSPAHTFCVGLGREVPEGNWYCEGCRPAAFASLNPQGLSPMPDQRASNMSGPASPFPGGIDLNAMYVPETPLSQETGNFPTFRRPMGDHHAASPVSGTGAFTVFDRRRIHLQINNILNNRMSQAYIRSNGISASSSGVRLFGSQLDQGRALTPQQTIFAETAAPLYSNNGGRLEGNAFALARNRDLVSARLGHFSGQVQNQTSTSAAAPLHEHGGFGMAFNPSLVHEQLHPCTSRSNNGADASLSPYACREVSHFNVEKGQVQQMVRSHLKSLSRDIDLGYGIVRDIARQSTHTVLAACGLEHRAIDVRPVQPSLICNHLGVGGAEMSLMKDSCSSCFNLFVKDVVRQIISCAM